MRILVVGYGYVGKAMTDMLLRKYDIDIYDPNKIVGWKHEAHNHEAYTVKMENYLEDQYDLIVVCVPTPSDSDGSCNTGIVEKVIKETNGDLYLIKSTVEPETTESLMNKTGKSIVFSPEYVGESKYFNSYFPDNMIEVPFVILGGREDDTQEIVDILLPILGPEKKYIQMSSLEAEIAKYMENTFFSMKITYCQEMFDLCESVGADWHKVREGWLADPRINPMHTAVFRNDRGFGGKCLPKDTKALVRYCQKSGSPSAILEAVLEKNKKLRKEE